MTDTQNKLVVDNYDLIHILLYKYLPYYKRNDFYGDAAIALCKAAITYKSGKGAKFRTYASTCIRNAIFDACGRHMHKNEIPTDECLMPEQVENFCEKDYNSWFRFLDSHAYISDRDKKVLKALACGYRICEISKQFGITSRTVNKIINNNRRYLYGEECECG